MTKLILKKYYHQIQQKWKQQFVWQQRHTQTTGGVLLYFCMLTISLQMNSMTYYLTIFPNIREKIS